MYSIPLTDESHLEYAMLKNTIDIFWDTQVLPSLQRFIAIPNKSPAFDPDWELHGHMEQAVELVSTWCQQQAIQGLSLTIHRLPKRTPVILIEIPGQGEQTVLLYGHLDKQPEMNGWRTPLSPWNPVLDGEKLYGRGSADDGYAVFSAITAIKALQQENQPHPRCVILIEASEESGSPDLPYYLSALRPILKKPSLIIGLDSSCGDYHTWWITNSLRGVFNGVLRVSITAEGVHSGHYSGMIPSSFRIIRQLLDRLEDAKTGTVLISECQADIPPARRTEAEAAALQLGLSALKESCPLLSGVQTTLSDPSELLLNATWRPTLCITGAEGLPSPKSAGNVLRPYTHLKLSFRTPPTVNVSVAAVAVKECLETNPPYGAHVTFELEDIGAGWHAPSMDSALATICDRASQTHFGAVCTYWGEGGSIPFMAMLGKEFPESQFIITGVLGPLSNAHGPNEFLHLPTAKKLTACLAEVLRSYSL